MKLWIFSLALLAGLALARADGPDLNQHTWRSNGLIYASADIPACHVARWERVVVLGTNAPFTNALSAMTVDEEVFTRRVVFSESLANFPMAFYRIHILRVFTCADFTEWTHACL